MFLKQIEIEKIKSSLFTYYVASENSKKNTEKYIYTNKLII